MQFRPVTIGKWKGVKENRRRIATMIPKDPTQDISINLWVGPGRGAEESGPLRTFSALYAPFKCNRLAALCEDFRV